MPNTISFSDHFLQFLREDYPKLPSAEQKIISQFIADYCKHGFTVPPLCGRNKSSADVPDDNKRNFALKYGLWHYHIGIPSYEMGNRLGDWTSVKIVNYMNRDATRDKKGKCKANIKLVSIASHPPFIIPNLSHITGETFPKT